MRDINKYKEDYVANQKFEDVLVKYRRIKSIEFLKKITLDRLLSLVVLQRVLSETLSKIMNNNY